MKFAEFYPGQVLSSRSYAVTKDEIESFANAYDPQWFHADAEAASHGRFKGLIASGWHTCSIAMRLAVETALTGSESFASPGVAYVKWPHPVRPGDSLKLEANVLESRVSNSKPDLGILRWRWHLRNQNDTDVLELEATSLFDLSSTPDNSDGSSAQTSNT